MPDTRALPDRVESALADDGPLAAAFEGFEPRPGQLRLAVAVARRFDQGGVLVAEAGTGTGKTLAYLVPSILSGRRVLISTGTRTLQDQIVYKDIPAIAAALGVDARATYMKGRTNYLCLHRCDRLQEARAGLPMTERQWLDEISDWAAETPTGDRAEIEGLPDEFPFWTELTATAEQCLGRECPRAEACFITRMRDRAAEANLVVVNHHLLCADAAVRQGAFGEVIPECDLLVVDEAHQLEDVVTQYFGVQVSGHRLEEFSRDLEQAGDALPGERQALAAAVAESGRAVTSAGRHLFDLARLELRQAGRGERMTLTPAVAGHLAEAGDVLADALGRLASVLRAENPQTVDLAALAERAVSLQADTRRLVAADDAAYVYFIEARGRGIALRAAPIDVGGLIAGAILAGHEASVLTSATLTVAASFEYMLGRLGVQGADTLRLPSEFDFREQAVLYLPPDMPDPKSPDFNRAAAWVIGRILDCTEGRAFVLFTSYAAMHEVRALLDSKISWPILMQGEAPRSALLRTFRATPHAVLLATSSFWQGVDVAGEALSCVIIDRLPFASPGDPIVQARITAIESRGGQPFNEYQVPLATLTLLQGLGRLIRTRSDRGVLSVLDPRLTRMRYGQRFLASLPPAPMTTDLAEIERFLRQP